LAHAGSRANLGKAKTTIAPRKGLNDMAATRKKTAKKSASKKSGPKVSTPKKSGPKKKSTRKYSPKASESVETEMHEMKRGKLRSGRSGKKVTDPKQAIAIGLAEARRSGAKVPAKKK
jgi:hypothetical protein